MLALCAWFVGLATYQYKRGSQGWFLFDVAMALFWLWLYVEMVIRAVKS
jgi:hypothetical protein